MKRSTSIVIAAALTALYNLVSLIRGAVDIATQNQELQNFGNGFAVVMVILSTIGLISAYGIWQNQKWGKVLAIIVMGLNGLVALPGVIFAPTLLLKLDPASTVVAAIVVIVLLLRRPEEAVVAE